MNLCDTGVILKLSNTSPPKKIFKFGMVKERRFSFISNNNSSTNLTIKRTEN